MKLSKISILSIALGLTMTGCGIGLASVVIQNQNDPEPPHPITDKAVEESDLNIQNGILKGFKDNVTPTYLKLGGYDTLKVPEGVTEIEDFAFTGMFDWNPDPVRPSGMCFISKLILPTTLTKIGNYAFRDCVGLNCDLILPQNIQYIGDEAFYYCQKLKAQNFVLPNSLTHIGQNAFRLCDNITGTITFNSGLSEVGYSAFAECSKLSGLDFSNFATIPSWLYKPYQYIFQSIGDSSTDTKTVSISITENSESEWQDVLEKRQLLPSGFKYNHLKELPEDQLTFADSSKNELTGLVDGVDLSQYDIIRIPDSVHTIAKNAFYDANNATGKIKSSIKIIFNNSLEKILENAFCDCSGLSGTLTLPNDLGTLEKAAFKDCTGINGTLVIPKLDSIPESCFEGCNNISKLYLPDGITSIDKRAFTNCSDISVIDVTEYREVPEWSSSEDDPNKPFCNLPLFGQIFFNPNCPIGSDAKWQETFIGLGLRDLGNWTFWNGDYMANVFPEDAQIHSITILDNSIAVGMTEYGKEQMKKSCILQFPEQIYEIQNNAFANVFNDKAIEENNNFWFIQLNNGISKIGDNAFKNCLGLWGNLVIPNSVTSIGSQAFYGCTGFKGQVLFPRALNEIKDSAFSSTEFRTVKFSSPNITFGSHIFSGCQGLGVIDLTSFTSVPQGWTGSSSAFADINETGGVVRINSKADKNAWTTLLTSLGLTWTIEVGE